MDNHDIGPNTLLIDPSLPAEARRRLIRRIYGPMNPVARALSNSLFPPRPLEEWEVRDPDVDRFIQPSNLDASCLRLLVRAQQAIGVILGSKVHADSQLGHAAGEKALREHEWQIAAALLKSTRLSAKFASNAADAPGPMTAAVLESHKRALTVAQDATTSRVTALERCAAQAEAADAAQRDWRGALKASELNDQYRDLVARTAADELAIAEITGLTEQAAAAEQVFRDSLHEAVLAAEALALPAAPQS
jgi:hypothetical protein